MSFKLFMRLRLRANTFARHHAIEAAANHGAELLDLNVLMVLLERLIVCRNGARGKTNLTQP